MNRVEFFNRLREKWGIKRNFDIVLILAVFTLSGSSVLFVTGYIINFTGLDGISSQTLKILIRTLLVVPAYQVLILLYGTLLGQLSFFWKNQKAFVRTLAKGASRSVSLLKSIIRSS
ncbi:DUF6787 family protein [candidate division KSB1 bacterium]